MHVVVLIVEVEQPEGLSARKLVLESHKHNVLTGYSGQYGLELLRRFPNVDMVVVHTGLTDIPTDEFIRLTRVLLPKTPIAAISPNPDVPVTGADYVISSHHPQALLELLASHFNAST